MLERRAKVIGLARRFGAAAVPPPAVKKRIGIEALLRWAYLEELPKAQPPERKGPAGYSAAAGFVVTASSSLEQSWVNRYGVVSDLLAQSEPHPDAVLVFEAVAALDQLEFVLPDGWDPFGDLGEMGGHKASAIAAVVDRLCVRDADGNPRLRNPVSELVFRCAVLCVPDCVADEPEVKFVCGGNGRPKWFVRRRVVVDGVTVEIEVDGMSATNKRPVYGAYRKTYLDPDPLEAGIARGEYEIWRAAVDILADELAGKLDSLEVERCELPDRPWEDDIHNRRRGIVLRDLSKA